MNQSTIDVYRDAFKLHLKNGLTHAEALAEFEEDKWNAAVLAELNEGGIRRNPETFAMETDLGDVPLFVLSGRAMRDQSNLDDMQQAYELWGAGWTSEIPKGAVDVMSWYWRRPSRRPGKPGRRYLSTNQAWMAMKKGKNHE